jgi:hypothetical protein
VEAEEQDVVDVVVVAVAVDFAVSWKDDLYV